MSFILNLLSGKKTYSIALVAAAVQFAVMVGWLDQETANYILTFLGIGGVATMRAAISKAEVLG